MVKNYLIYTRVFGTIMYLPAAVFIFLISMSGSPLGAGAVVARFFTNLSVQVPEPGMMLLFGLGTAALGLRIGRHRKP